MVLYALLYVAAGYASLEPLPTASQPAASTHPLRVLTWNIQGCAAGLEAVVQELQKHNPDVICLQEVEVGTSHTNGSDQAKLISAKLHMRQASAGSQFATGGEQRMAILSREPLEQIEALDAATGRVYGVTAVTRHHGNPARIVCVHLTCTFKPDPKHILRTTRARTKEAADLDSRLSKWTGPIILAGDFNAVVGGREHALIAKTMTRVPTTQPTYPAAGPVLAIDHVYHSAELRTVRFEVFNTKASDHRPVLVELDTLEPQPQTAPSRSR